MPSGRPIPEDVREEIVELLADAIARRQKKSALKRMVRDILSGSEWEAPSIATLERLITEARGLLRVNSGTDRDRARAEAIAFYEALSSDESASVGDRLRAQERLDKILGLEYKGAVSDDADEQAKRIREVLNASRSA